MATQPALFPTPGHDSELDSVTKSLLIDTNPKPEGKPDPADSRPEGAAEKPEILDPGQPEEETISEEAAEEPGDDPRESDDGEEELGEHAEDDLEEIVAEEPGDTVYEVPVDGKTQRVTLDELKRDYSGRQAIEARIQEASEAKNAALAQVQALQQERQQTNQALQLAQATLAQDADPDIDWEALYEVDRTEWSHQRELQRVKQEKRNSLQQAVQQQTEGEERRLQGVLQEKIASESAILRNAVPVFQDAKSGEAHRQKLVQFALDRYGKHGLTEADIQGVQMAVPLIMLHELHEMSEANGEAKVKTAKRRRIKRSVRPGTGTKISEVAQSQKRQERLQKRAEETGHPDDVAALMLQPKR